MAARIQNQESGMQQATTDVLLRIRPGSPGAFPVEAWLSDGSFYQGEAHLNDDLFQRLREAQLEPVRYGELLSEALFDRPIAAAFDVATGLARQQNDGRLRIRLLLDRSLPDELHVIK
jgi:hypothetical protein